MYPYMNLVSVKKSGQIKQELNIFSKSQAGFSCSASIESGSLFVLPDVIQDGRALRVAHFPGRRLEQRLERRNLLGCARVADVRIAGHDVGIGDLLAGRVEESVEREARLLAAQLGHDLPTARIFEGFDLVLGVLHHVEMRDDEAVADDGLQGRVLEGLVQLLAPAAPGGVEDQEDCLPGGLRRIDPRVQDLVGGLGLFPLGEAERQSPEYQKGCGHGFAHHRILLIRERCGISISF